MRCGRRRDWSICCASGAPLGFIAIWMATNFVFGAGAQALGASEAPVAWIAHVGGFVAGLLAFPLFDRAPSQAR